MKNMILNHEKLLSAINHYCELAVFSTKEEKLTEKSFGNQKLYEGQVRINIGDEAIVFIYFKKDKTISFLVQGIDTELGGTVVTTLINIVKRG